ncbi:MAG: hypothetical protein SGI77_08915 [Pirellulaceae bacterium]|nr:hypothetical protein [Pirellulaceae bacterium]
MFVGNTKAYSQDDGSIDPIVDLFETVAEGVLTDILDEYPDIIPGVEDVLDFLEDEPETAVGIGIGIGVVIIEEGIDSVLEILDDLGVDTTFEFPDLNIFDGEDLFGGDFDLDLTGQVDLLNDTIELNFDYDYSIDIGDWTIDVSIDFGYDWNYVDDTLTPDGDTLIDFNIIITP